MGWESYHMGSLGIQKRDTFLHIIKYMYVYRKENFLFIKLQTTDMHSFVLKSQAFIEQKVCEILPQESKYMHWKVLK